MFLEQVRKMCRILFSFSPSSSRPVPKNGAVDICPRISQKVPIETNPAPRSGPQCLLIHLLHFPVHTLGPGQRVGLWVQGCSLRCQDCVSTHTWAFDEKRAVPVDDLVAQIAAFWKTQTPPPDGLTVSGGEPFDQAGALFDLLTKLRIHGVGDILVFSGYSLRELLKQHPHLPESVTALIDGPFEAGNETDARQKGSGAQTLTLFHPEYENAYSTWAASRKNSLQFIRGEEGSFIIGIPFQNAPEIRRQFEKVFQNEHKQNREMGDRTENSMKDHMENNNMESNNMESNNRKQHEK